MHNSGTWQYTVAQRGSAQRCGTGFSLELTASPAAPAASDEGAHWDGTGSAPDEMLQPPAFAVVQLVL